jgi:hypothetical protein
MMGYILGFFNPLFGGAGVKVKKVVEYFSIIFGTNMVLSKRLFNALFPFKQCMAVSVQVCSHSTYI